MLLRKGDGVPSLFSSIVMVFKRTFVWLVATAVLVLCSSLHAAASVLWGGQHY